MTPKPPSPQELARGGYVVKYTPTRSDNPETPLSKLSGAAKRRAQRAVDYARTHINREARRASK